MFPSAPVKDTLTRLLKEGVEEQLLNINQYIDKYQFFGHIVYMLSGVLLHFNEEEFYLNVVVLIESFYLLLINVLKVPEKYT